MKNYDSYEEIFIKAVNAIAVRYEAGALDYAYKRLPSIVKEIHVVEDKLNRIWKNGQNEKDGIRKFRELLKRWYFLHLKIIEKYKEMNGERFQQQNQINLIV